MEYGEKFDPINLGLTCRNLGKTKDCEIIYPDVDTEIVGDTLYNFKVILKGKEMDIKHTIRVMKSQTNGDSIEVSIVSINDFSLLKKNEIFNRIFGFDNSKIKKLIVINKFTSTTIKEYKSIKKLIEDKAKYSPGIYTIVAKVSTKKEKSSNKTIDFLYKLTPDKMADPYTFIYNNEKYVLANKWVPLPSNYMSNVEEEAKLKMGKMLDAMKSEGISIKIISGFRSYYEQEKIFNEYVRKAGYEEASRYSAEPGYSEHQTGLTFDIGKIDESFEKTKAFSWLTDNAHKYGFIMRYPKDKEEVTGYMYEPWHYRYLGEKLATDIKQSELTLEEFIGYICEQ